MNTQPVSMAISPIKFLPLRFPFLHLHHSSSDWVLNPKWENCMFSQAAFVVVNIFITLIITCVCACVAYWNLLGLSLKPFVSVSCCIHVFRFLLRNLLAINAFILLEVVIFKLKIHALKWHPKRNLLFHWRVKASHPWKIGVKGCNSVEGRSKKTGGKKMQRYNLRLKSRGRSRGRKSQQQRGALRQKWKQSSLRKPFNPNSYNLWCLCHSNGNLLWFWSNFCAWFARPVLNHLFYYDQTTSAGVLALEQHAMWIWTWLNPPGKSAIQIHKKIPLFSGLV